MKYLFIIISLFFTNESCRNQSQSEKIAFEYTAASRGSFYKVSINQDTISVQKTHNGEPIQTPCSKSNWQNLNKTLKTITIESITTLEAPSKAHQHDGAAIANLTVAIDQNVYETVSFDHGNPPKEIEALVKEILSIAQNIE